MRVAQWAGLGTPAEDCHTAETPYHAGDEFTCAVPSRPLRDWLRIAAHDNDLLEMSYNPERRELRITTLGHYIPRRKTIEEYTARTVTIFRCMDISAYPPIPTTEAQ